LSAIQEQAYRNAQKTTTTGRDLEAHVLTQTALKLAESLKHWQDGDVSDPESVFEALRNNQHLWTVFQSELTKEDNPLPLNIKEDLINLSLFVDKRTFELMAELDPEKVKILIDINMNIAAGLQGSGDA
jgi:flagellar protein FlaF